jgi:D-alanyl-D-alanine carboxypeptidase/D-alanyl-D-alanine endopeptidase (penicillin-binding protein 7)
MIKKIFATVVLALSTAAASAVPLGSQSVLVIEDDTGKVLIEKNANAVVSIASLTKLMTAMVVLDARQDMDEMIAIGKEDVDMLKFSSSRVPVGARISRGDILRLALMSSDNRAAHSLGRTYPGGTPAFKAAVRAKIAALGMTNTVIEEPTGLSPNNKSTAADLVKMAQAAAEYPEITEMSTEARDIININGRGVGFNNTNRLVGAKGWDIGLSKTGYTSEAGRCLIMNIKTAGKNATMVLLNASASSARILDALNVRRFITGEPVNQVVRASSKAPRFKASAGRSRVKASSKAKSRVKAVKKRTSAKVKSARKRRN